MMKAAKLKSFLEVATNVAVLLVAIAVLGTFVANLTRKSGPQLHVGLEKGQALADIPSINYSNSPKTMLIAMSTKCHYCSESAPFYKQLVDAYHASGNQIRLVAVFPESENEVKAYIQQQQLDIETVSSVNFQSINVSGTPSLILVDSRGKIQDFWLGKLPNDVEQQVLKSIS
jgi:thioredoxin-related protein